jgi:hypothetical protein
MTDPASSGSPDSPIPRLHRRLRFPFRQIVQPELLPVHLRINAVSVIQRIMVSRFDNAAVFQHQNVIGAADGHNPFLR